MRLAATGTDLAPLAAAGALGVQHAHCGHRVGQGRRGPPRPPPRHTHAGPTWRRCPCPGAACGDGARVSASVSVSARLRTPSCAPCWGVTGSGHVWGRAKPRAARWASARARLHVLGSGMRTATCWCVSVHSRVSSVHGHVLVCTAVCGYAQPGDSVLVCTGAC